MESAVALREWEAHHRDAETLSEESVAALTSTSNIVITKCRPSLRLCDLCGYPKEVQKTLTFTVFRPFQYVEQSN